MTKLKNKKLKTKKSVARRFKVTGTGKVLRRGSHNRHLKRRKNSGQVRKQSRPQQVKGRLRIKIMKVLGK